jgi:sugar lactone lactonase YvrE
LPSSGCKRLQKIFLFNGVFHLPFRPLADETTTSTKGRTMKTITKLIYLAFTVVILAIGAVTANGAPNDLFVSINGDGNNGGGFIYKYNPGGVQSIFAAGLSRPRGVAFDHSGNLFVATNTFDSVSGTLQLSIVKITPDGAQSTFATLSGNLKGQGVAFDGAGNLFVMANDQNDPNLASTIYKFTPGGVQSTFGSVPGQGFALAFDSAGNLFTTVNYAVDPSELWKFAPDGTSSVFATNTDTVSAWGDLAFDRFGNLFNSTDVPFAPGLSKILKFTPDGEESDFATDLTEPRGVAFDRGGNLFVVNRAFEPPGDILKFTPNGVETVFASGIDGPQFLAFQLLPTPRLTR